MFIKMRSILNIFLILTVIGLFSACADSSFTPPSGGGGTGGGDGGDTGGGDGGDTGGGTGACIGGGDNSSITTLTSIFDPFSNALYFSRNCLTVDEKKTYDLVVKTMLSDYTALVGDQGGMFPVENSIKIDLVLNNIKGIKNKEQLNKIVSFLESDEPRLFHISNTTPISIPNVLEWDIGKPEFLKDSDGNIKEFYVRIEIGYSDYAKYVEDMNTMEVKVQTILNSMGDITTDSKPQIVRNIHEKYLATVSYGKPELESSNDIRGSFLKPFDGYYYTMHNGYSRTMLYLLQRLDIKAVSIVGMYMNSHNGGTSLLFAWNKVDVGDGKWYNIDSTSDDSVFTNSPDSDKNFFLKSDADYKDRYYGVNKDKTDQPIGYLKHGVSMPKSPATSLTPSEYQ